LLQETGEKFYPIGQELQCRSQQQDKELVRVDTRLPIPLDAGVDTRREYTCLVDQANGTGMPSSRVAFTWHHISKLLAVSEQFNMRCYRIR
jgi:hypothetical protein